VVALLAAVAGRPRTGLSSRCCRNEGPISLNARCGPLPRRSSDHPDRVRPSPFALRSRGWPSWRSVGWACP